MPKYTGCIVQKKDEYMYQTDFNMKFEKNLKKKVMNVNAGKVPSTLLEGILVSKDEKETVDLEM